MNDLIRKKVILCLLDSEPKSADAIADEIGESLTTVGALLTTLVSANICEAVTQGDGGQYAIRKDIEAFAQMVKEFLSDPEEHKQETVNFITSECYLTRIDSQLVDYVLNRFYLDSVYRTDEDGREALQRILLASPSAVFFALHHDTTSFHESWSDWNRLKSSATTPDRVIQILRSSFTMPLLESLMADVEVYNSLYSKLQIRVAKIGFQVGLATVNDRYLKVMGEQNYAFYKMAEGETPREGALVSLVDPMSSSDDGLAFLNLGEFQAAFDSFSDALEGVKDPGQRAVVLNNKGLAFLRFEQYQKAIECFEEGIALDSDGKTPQLRANKQIAEKYLAVATDTDKLTEPTQVPFTRRTVVPFEETRFYEFKEIKGRNPVDRIEDNSDEYAVAFLNRQGGRVFWGVRDENRMTVGVELDEQQRDEIRVRVSNKVGSIRPPISPEQWHLEFHNVYNLQNGDIQGEIVENLWIVELVVPPPQERNVFYTGGGSLYVKTDGGKKKLIGPEVTEFIRNFLQSETEQTESAESTEETAGVTAE